MTTGRLGVQHSPEFGVHRPGRVALLFSVLLITVHSLWSFMRLSYRWTDAVTQLGLVMVITGPGLPGVDQRISSPRGGSSLSRGHPPVGALRLVPGSPAAGRRRL